MSQPLNRHPQFRMFRTVAAHARTGPNDLLLGALLAFVAGATNAGGFLAIGQYTSHMSGVISSVADNLALGLFSLVGAGLMMLVSFIAGAGGSAILINWGRRNARRKQYAYPIALEAVLLLNFGAIGSVISHIPQAGVWVAALLCFIMGLQNATITKISGARIRTTHMTGMVTDIGIELGKLAYRQFDRQSTQPPVRPDMRKLRILLRVVGMFLLGGLVGALGFKHLGYGFCMPLAALLLALASPQLFSPGHRRRKIA